MGITCDICGEPCRRRVGSQARSRPGKARGHGRVKHEATAGSSTRPRPGQARGRGSCGGHCQGCCEAGAREHHGRPFAQDLSPQRRPPGIIPGGRRFVRTVAEASVRRRSRPSIRFMRSVVASTGRAMRSTQAYHSRGPRPTRSCPARSSPADAAPVSRPRRCDR